MNSVQPVTVPFRFNHVGLGFVAAVLLNGCSLLHPHDDPTRFYVLTPSEAVPENHTGEVLRRLSIGLKTVDIPAYLRTKAIVIRTGANEIHLAEFDRWGEPLDQGISRVIGNALRSKSNVQSVTMNSHSDDSRRCEVAIRILACEGVRVDHGTSSIRFEATWEIRTFGTNSTTIKQGEYIANGVVWDGKSYDQLAERLSNAIVEASFALASDLPMESTLPSKPMPRNVNP